MKLISRTCGCITDKDQNLHLCKMHADKLQKALEKQYIKSIMQEYAIKTMLGAFKDRPGIFDPPKEPPK